MTSVIFLLTWSSELIGGTLTVLLVARAYLEWTRPAGVERIVGFLNRATGWLVSPLRSVLPVIRRIDLACLLLAVITQTLVHTLLFMLHGASLLPHLLLGFAGLGLLTVIRLAIYALIAVLLLSVIISWARPGSVLDRWLGALAAPILSSLRARLPHPRGMDLAPLVLSQSLGVVVLLIARLHQGLFLSLNWL